MKSHVCGVVATAIVLLPVLSFAQTDVFERKSMPFGAWTFPGQNVLMLGESRSFLGVGVKEIDSERAKALKLKEEYGVEITRVEEDSPAEKAGLKVGDVVLEYNGQRVEGTEQFIRLVRETPTGRNVRLQINRAGAPQTITAAIAARKGTHLQTFEMPRINPRDFEVIVPDIPKTVMSWRNPMLGVDGESVESQLADFFGVKEGVLVRSVFKGSAAEKAGIKAGDVITKVDDTKVASPRDITSALRGAREKKTVNVVLMREKKEVTVSVTVDEESGARPVIPRSRAITERKVPL